MVRRPFLRKRGPVTAGRVTGWFTRADGAAFGFVNTDAGRVYVPGRSLGPRAALTRGDVVKLEISTDRLGRVSGRVVDVLQHAAPAAGEKER